MEGLLTHGTAERFAVGGQVALQFHLAGEALRAKQTAVRLGQVKVVDPHMHLNHQHTKTSDGWSYGACCTKYYSLISDDKQKISVKRGTIVLC